MKVLVTGGAGYIGSTVVSALQDAGDEPVVVDDLSRGSAEFLRAVPHVVGDIADRTVLDLIFTEHPDIELVIHCAARIVVSESISHPAAYYRANVVKSIELVDHLLDLGCNRMIFSSSAAVYGDAAAPGGVITEDAPLLPQSPYARTKVMVEHLLAGMCASSELTALTLRYFNPVGCDPRGRSWPYDPAPTHALGSLMRAWDAGETFYIHGADYPTPDGTPVRDFVHVWDVALAHVAAAHNWTPSGDGFDVVNVGSGRGTSVLQLADTFNRRVEHAVPIEFDGRRPGDTAGCYTSTQKALDMFGWRPSRTVDDAIVDLLALRGRR